MAKLIKLISVLVGIAIPIGITYWWAVFSTTVDINMCYSQVISFISEVAVSTAKSKSESDVAAFKSMLKALPLHGYETNCNEVLEAADKFKEAHVQTESPKI